MNWISETDFIDELLHNALTVDLIKGRALLVHLPDVSESIQRQVLTELDCGDPAFAIPMVGYLLGDLKADLAISREELLMILGGKAQEAPEYFLDVLTDDTLTDKSAFVELVSVLPVEALLPGLLQRLETAEAPTQIHPLLTAIKYMAPPEAVPVLSDYLYSGHRDLVVETVQALAQIGTPDAIDALTARLGADHDMDTHIVDALAETHTGDAIRHLVQWLDAPDAHVRNRAKTRLTEMAAAVPDLIDALQCPKEDAQIHTLNVLGAIGDATAIRPIRRLLHNEPANPNVRFAAYEALGMLPIQQGGFALAAGLADPELMVRIAAAKAIEKNLDPLLIAGLKNMTKSETEETRQIAAALIDSPADRSLISVMDSPAFVNQMLRHLERGAHPEARIHVEHLLRQSGQSDLANRVETIGKNASQKSKLLVYAVDDSRMVLSLYKTAFHQLGCEVQIFEFPESALDQVQSKKPDMIFTDLNMPALNGIELAAAIRKHYTETQLPIVMVTTQSEGHDFEKAKQVGVSAVIHKPFTPQMLKETLMQYIPQ